MTSYKDMEDKWHKEENWRELALAPRSSKIHEQLDQHTKELQSLEVGDQVIVQNQLGNNPKRWDKRGVVVCTDK